MDCDNLRERFLWARGLEIRNPLSNDATQHGQAVTIRINNIRNRRKHDWCSTIYRETEFLD